MGAIDDAVDVCKVVVWEATKFDAPTAEEWSPSVSVRRAKTFGPSLLRCRRAMDETLDPPSSRESGRPLPTRSCPMAALRVWAFALPLLDYAMAWAAAAVEVAAVARRLHRIATFLVGVADQTLPPLCDVDLGGFGLTARPVLPREAASVSASLKCPQLVSTGVLITEAQAGLLAGASLYADSARCELVALVTFRCARARGRGAAPACLVARGSARGCTRRRAFFHRRRPRTAGHRRLAAHASAAG